MDTTNMRMDCFQHGEYRGKECPKCKPKIRRDEREQICCESVERIRKLLEAHGIDTEAADDPAGIGFGLAEILHSHVFQLHQLGACLMADWVDKKSPAPPSEVK